MTSRSLREGAVISSLPSVAIPSPRICPLISDGVSRLRHVTPSGAQVVNESDDQPATGAHVTSCDVIIVVRFRMKAFCGQRSLLLTRGWCQSHDMMIWLEHVTN